MRSQTGAVKKRSGREGYPFNYGYSPFGDEELVHISGTKYAQKFDSSEKSESPASHLQISYNFDTKTPQQDGFIRPQSTKHQSFFEKLNSSMNTTNQAFLKRMFGPLDEISKQRISTIRNFTPNQNRRITRIVQDRGNPFINLSFVVKSLFFL